MKPKQFVRRWKSTLPLAAALVTASSSFPCLAADIVWNAGDSSFSTPGNWNGGAVPGTGDIAEVNNGGTVQIGTDWAVGGINAGNADGDTGAFVMSDGTLTLGTARSHIGRAGEGTLTITGGTINKTGGGGEANAFVIGRREAGSGASGVVNHSGGTLTSSSEVFIGWGGGGTGAAGTYNLSGTGVLNVGNWFAIGRNGATGVLNMTGGTFNKTSNDDHRVVLGTNGGVGTINISAGVFNNTNSRTWLGEGGTGVINLSGTGEMNLALLRLGENANSTGLVFLNGGTLAVTQITKSGAAIEGSITFNGGVLKARGNHNEFMQGLTGATIQAGGAIIDSDHFGINIGQNLLDGDLGGDGDTLVKRGSGALGLSGANSFTGAITVEQGALTGRTTASLPGWNTENHITVESGGALGASLGDGGFSQSDFETLLSSADMQAGSSVAIDTSIGSLTYSTDIAALPTGLGADVGLHKTGPNNLTIDMNQQTFTGGLVSNGGALIVGNLAGTDTRSIRANPGGSIVLENNSDHTYNNPLSGGGGFVIRGDGDKTLTNVSGTIGAFTKEGAGDLNLPSGITTTGNVILTGTGEVNLSGGALSSGNETQIGQGAGSNITLNIGDGESLTSNNWLAVGRGGGTGTVEMTGGTLTKQTNGSFFIGGRDGGQSTGIFNQHGGLVNVVNGQLWIGQNENNTPNKSSGTYNLHGGDVVINSWLAVGREGAVGELNIHGGTFLKQGNDHVELGGGNTGSGTVNQDGGVFRAATGEIRLGLGTNSTSSWNLSGTGEVDAGLIQIAFGGSGSGTFNLDGGILAATKIQKGTSSGTAAFNFNGGVLRAKAEEAAFLQGLNTASVHNGGAIIDSGGFNIRIAQALLAGTGSGGLTKRGDGILTLTGESTYTGATTIEGGTLALSGSGSISASTSLNLAGGSFDISGISTSSYTVGSGQSIVGTGTVNASGKTFVVAGTIAPGASPGALAFIGDLTLAGIANLEVASAGGIAGTDYDLISATGLLTYGGDLTVAFASAFAGSFNLFDSGDTAGDFDSVTISGFGGDVALSNSGGTWTGSSGAYSFSFSQDDGILTVIPEPSVFGLAALGLLAFFRRARR